MNSLDSVYFNPDGIKGRQTFFMCLCSLVVRAVEWYYKDPGSCPGGGKVASSWRTPLQGAPEGIAKYEFVKLNPAKTQVGLIRMLTQLKITL